MPNDITEDKLDRWVLKEASIWVGIL